MQNYLFIPKKGFDKVVYKETPKICLNMIVKNEEKVIERLLNSVVPMIDTFCICDTGSTDNTIAIIRRFFQERGIKGEIVEEPFRDFAYSRNFAMKRCHQQDLLKDTDYLLLVDADMVLEIKPEMVYDLKSSLSKDAYYVLQGSDTFCYKNIRFLRNDARFSYYGVTHEYIQLAADSATEFLPKETVFLRDIGDGGSKKGKFERDVRLLEKALKENPKNERYTFYLANSLRDLGKWREAIDVYHRRIEMGGWIEEVWYSFYSIGNCYEYLKKMPDALYYWLEAYHRFPARWENVYKIIRYYREQERYDTAYVFYVMLMESKRKTNFNRDDHLFLEKDVYDYKLKYEFSIMGYYCNWNKYDIVAANRDVLAVMSTPENIRVRVMANYKYYAPALEELKGASPPFPVIDFLNFDKRDDPPPSSSSSAAQRKQQIDPVEFLGPDFTESSPSIVFDENNKAILLCIRYVNYRISPTCGGYKLKDTITTQNRMIRFSCEENGELNKTHDFLLKYNTTDDAYYCGIEDIRIFVDGKGQTVFNGNRVLKSGNIVIEHGIVDWENQSAASLYAKTTDGERKIEKNWVLFRDTADNTTKVVYEWFPLTIGQYEYSEERKELQLNILEKDRKLSLLKNVRGSTNGVSMPNGETWFLCHVVSYEDKYMYYYHLFVVMDDATPRNIRVSKYFTFGKKENNRVEYTLGFIYLKENNAFLIGYSQMDCETHFLTISKEQIDELFYTSEE
jgi:tetratricopeptide (TPR) repeat protein